MRLFGLAVLSAIASFSIPYGIAVADDVTDQLKACRSISDVAARANCYDRIVDRLPAAPLAPAGQVRAPQPPVPPAQVARPAAPVPPIPPAAKTPTERFGESDLAEQKRVPQAELPPDTLVATVTAMRIEGSGYGVFTLDNGQVWRQTEASGLKIPNGARIKIKSGLMGAFYISLENGNKSFRARRVK